MAFKQYKDAPVKTVLTGAEKIHITDIDGTLKQVSIDSIGPETESIVSDNSNKVPTSAAIKAFVESKMDDVKMPIEVESAIETGGIGWTETEEKAGFDIQWDGNTEGLEKAGDFYKVSNRILSKNEFLGGTLFAGDETVVITDDSEIFHELIPNKLYAFGGSGGVLISAGVEYDGKTLSSGVYFSKDHEFYISRLYKKEATTEEVVHQIDQKYIPSSPEVTNAIETGGIGYTEVETIFLADNERVTTVIDDVTGWFIGKFTTPFDIVDGTYTVIFNGEEYNLNSAFRYHIWYLGDISENGAPDFSRYPFVISSEFEETYLATESAGDYEVTIKMESETIHKIDTKYLPSEVFVIDIDDDDWENISTDPDFGLAVWKAFQSGKQIYIRRGIMPNFGYAVVSKVRIGRSGGPAYLELSYIMDYFYYRPEGADKEYTMPCMDYIILPIDIDSLDI